MYISSNIQAVRQSSTTAPPCDSKIGKKSATYLHLAVSVTINNYTYNQGKLQLCKFTKDARKVMYVRTYMAKGKC